MKSPAFTFATVGTPTPAHETLRVFVNGASAGLLTLRTDEVPAFKARLAQRSDLVGMIKHLGACYRSGNPVVLAMAFDDVATALLAMEARGEISLDNEGTSP